MGQQKIELLAPAGTWEALEAAVNAGADAVYLGGKAFGARQYANNFNRDEMVRAVSFAHLHRVRIYVTVNILIDDSEMYEVADYLVFLSNIGIDGIIVQDLGVVRLSKLVAPNLPLHASTQMTITNSSGVAFAAASGMERTVLARELSLAEIKSACAENTEIEVFIHGALCICYSGQCLMSSLIGGRSGNRGRCAQPCRLPYKLLDKEARDMLEGKNVGHYLLSPRDMNTLSILPQLIETGVVSYKIEGRMKRPEYVAVVVDIYRRAIDSFFAGNYHVSRQDLENIEQIFNRDFTTAYLTGRPGREMMSDSRPNNRGILVGRVIKLEKGRSNALVKLERDLHIGDGLEFWVSVGGRVGITVNSIKLDGSYVSTARTGEQVTIDVPGGVRVNDRIFRIFDSNLMEYAGNFFGPNVKKCIMIKGCVEAYLGKPLRIIFTDDEGNTGHGETAFITEIARNRPLDENTVKKQVDRLGTTEYFLENLVFKHDKNIMVPVSEINEARRQAVEELNSVRIAAFSYKRKYVEGINEIPLPKVKCKHTGSIITVHCDTIEKVEVAINAGADRIIFGGDNFSREVYSSYDYRKVIDKARKAGKEIAFATPRIVKEKQLFYFKKLFSQWNELEPDYVYISNIGLWPMAKKCPKLKLWTGLSINTYNSQSLAFWAEAGAKGAVLSAELTMAQIENLARKTPVMLECIVQGRLEMMVSEYCVAGSFLGNLHNGACTFKCREPLFLSDRKEIKFPIATDQYCKMHILNADELSLAANVRYMKDIGIHSMRIDARSYAAAEVGKFTRMYKEILQGEREFSNNLPGTTRGHYFRGVI
ncbi:MAG: U32 family peptidase [Phascolarctobacterium sp.]|nr:U32 family peptidase [Phascolarctobacterium sp.]